MVTAQSNDGYPVDFAAMHRSRAERGLAAADKRRLRARAHKLKPVIIVGAPGISRSLIAALEQALEDHGLVKVRINADDRAARRALVDELCSRCAAELVQTIGHVAVLFREKEDEAPKVARSQVSD
jgi:RNA-binding protein